MRGSTAALAATGPPSGSAKSPPQSPQLLCSCSFSVLQLFALGRLRMQLHLILPLLLRLELHILWWRHDLRLGQVHLFLLLVQLLRRQLLSNIPSSSSASMTPSSAVSMGGPPSLKRVLSASHLFALADGGVSAITSSSPAARRCRAEQAFQARKIRESHSNPASLGIDRFDRDLTTKHRLQTQFQTDREVDRSASAYQESCQPNQRVDRSKKLRGQANQDACPHHGGSVQHISPPKEDEQDDACNRY